MKQTPVIVALCLASLLTSSNELMAQEANHNFEVTKNLDIFNSIYKSLDMYYVDSLDAKELIRTGIDAMLDGLDPYTEYFPEEEMGDLKMMTTGKYGGIGSVIRMRKDSTVIIYEPYAGMPAAEAGLQVGDVLLKIDGKDLKGMVTSEVSDLLRGEPGTTFVLRVQRPGEKKTRDFKIIRKNIKVPAISYYGMVGQNGYINLTQFTENCSADVRKAVILLKEQGAEAIILDLRNNGGGLLDEAVKIVNLFVPKDLTIVETKGKVRATEATYATREKPLDLDMPLVVLVNGGTASAAEIVSGSLQDLDRAVIIGSKTFGKGLVQAPRELPYNGSVKLTTGKYYIPSGRCIQKIDYKKRRDRKTSQAQADTLGQIFKTHNGREVRDAGGITPDIEVKHDTMQNILYYLSNDDVLIDYGTKYCQTHDKPESVAAFTLTDQDFDDFRKMALESGFKYDRMSLKSLQELKKVMQFEGYFEDAKSEFTALEQKLSHDLDTDLKKHKKDIMKLMASEIIKRYYYQAGVVEEFLKDDEDLKKATEILSNTEEYRKILNTDEKEK